MSDRLRGQTSPYLLQHADNPVDWYPWCGEAFQRAREEDKPIFLSIGYSTCHWCHVMAHESFEDPEIAGLLNRHFISIKVDKEERPDIDSIYMAVCQAFTGSGGWPTSIFMTADQKPFFAGTYFPPRTRRGMIGLGELLTAIHEEWEQNRSALLEQADLIVNRLARRGGAEGKAGPKLLEDAAALYKQTYDPRYGGFGGAPKFPSPHNLLFLLSFFQRRGDVSCLKMAEKTLLQMYRGGLFDHIGGGFCRYSTDERFLVPHFEKMLYDNALLMMAYSKAYCITRKAVYLQVAEKTAAYVLREMTAPEGGFYSAQDADSGGEEGAYYLLTPDEIVSLLGPEDGAAFNRRFDITQAGNFEGKSIPNLLSAGPLDDPFAQFLPQIAQYRKTRFSLHLDDKILTAWNGLTIAALCQLYLASGEGRYLEAAQRADRFLWENLCQDGVLYVSFRDGKRGEKGFLDDYANTLFAQLALYRSTLEEGYLDRAKQLCGKVLSDFRDPAGGFYLYGKDSEQLILRPKETYDGALPSGNSIMAWDLVRLSLLTSEERFQREAARQLDLLASDAVRYPAGYAMFLSALLDDLEPPAKVTIISEETQTGANWPLTVREDVVLTLRRPDETAALKNGRTTFYVCRGRSCLPPVNELDEDLKAAAGTPCHGN